MNSIYQFFHEDETEIQRVKERLRLTDIHHIYTDGASKSNPGPSGVGYAISTQVGGKTFSNSVYIGEGTNNRAEYMAIIYGLRSCNRLGITNLKVFSDSKVVISQIKGECETNEPNLQILNNEAKELCMMFKSIELNWIARKHNKEADKLANAAIPKDHEKATEKASTPAKKAKKQTQTTEDNNTKVNNEEISQNRRKNAKSAQKKIEQYFTETKDQAMDEEDDDFYIDKLLEEDREKNKAKNLNPSTETKLDNVEIEEITTEDSRSLSSRHRYTNEEHKKANDIPIDMNVNRKNYHDLLNSFEPNQDQVKPSENSQMETFFHMMKVLIAQTSKKEGIQQNYLQEVHQMEVRNRIESSINDIHHRTVIQEQGVHNLMELGYHLLQKNNQIELAIGEIGNFGNTELLPWKQQVTEGVGHIYNSVQSLEQNSNTTLQGCRTLETWVIELAEEVKNLKDENKLLKEKIGRMTCPDSSKSEKDLPKAVRQAIVQSRKQVSDELVEILNEWKEEQEQWLCEMDDKIKEIDKLTKEVKEKKMKKLEPWKQSITMRRLYSKTRNPTLTTKNHRKRSFCM